MMKSSWCVFKLLLCVACAYAVRPEPLTRDHGVLGVHWSAPFFSGGGYCSEAIDFVRSLVPHTEVRISHHGDSFDAQFVRGLPKDVQRLLSQLGRGSVQPSEAVVVCHSEPGAWYPALYQTSLCPDHSALYKVGRTMFETDRLPSGWSQRLNAMDEVWVPTEFHRTIFIDGGVTASKVHIVGESVDVDFYDPVAARASTSYPFPLRGHRQDDFKFLSVFKWEERKGWKTLIEAFVREFSADDQVTLYILTSAFHSTDDFSEAIEEYLASLVDLPAHSRPRIHLLQRGIPTASMPAVYASVDAFVLPSKGEGWGRPHVEAMSMGLPVIATHWSGPTAFMTENNSFPLPISGLEEIPSGAFRGHKWATPDRLALQRLMREVVSHPDEARARGQRARQDMIAKFCPQCVAAQVLARLHQIKVQLLDAGKQLVHYPGAKPGPRHVGSPRDEL
jgi:glycosyltransferase involved in cell wall biosynthesis